MDAQLPSSAETATAEAADSGPRSTGARSKVLLIVEPDYMLRRTVALTARSLDLGEINETSTYEDAQAILSHRHIDGLLLALGDGEQGFALLERIRGGAMKCAADLPVAVVAHGLDLARATRLRDLGVVYIAVRPAKARALLEAMSAIARPRA
ncbi:MAG TPA: hypothetical protein VH105_20490 [Burkholderiales bacterium]|jgi:DNA-binding response OmpR family regulator|nr:hypothetical protein [Burkholderiales bacterium]